MVWRHWEANITLSFSSRMWWSWLRTIYVMNTIVNSKESASILPQSYDDTIIVDPGLPLIRWPLASHRCFSVMCYLQLPRFFTLFIPYQCFIPYFRSVTYTTVYSIYTNTIGRHVGILQYNNLLLIYYTVFLCIENWLTYIRIISSVV